jgi:hypothetical protein
VSERASGWVTACVRVCVSQCAVQPLADLSVLHGALAHIRCVPLRVLRAGAGGGGRRPSCGKYE